MPMHFSDMNKKLSVLFKLIIIVFRYPVLLVIVIASVPSVTFTPNFGYVLLSRGLTVNVVLDFVYEYLHANRHVKFYDFHRHESNASCYV